MSIVFDIYPREAYDSVVVVGGAGFGKTEHKEQLGQFFGLTKFVDEAARSGFAKPEKGVLYLTNIDAEDLCLDPAGTNVLVITFERALRAIEAKKVVGGPKSGPTGPTGSVMPRDYASTPHGQQDSSLNSKDTNPKDAVGVAKVPESTVPQGVIAELGVAMMEGALKYGRHNYRIAGVRASVYFDANMRHMKAWWEGEDIDQDSLLSHVTKSIATLVVLRDAMMNGNWVDDRPPPMKDPEWQRKLNQVAAGLLVKYPNPKPAITRDHQE